MFRAGDQVPLILLFDCSASGASVSPSQIGATAVNVGVVF
ncbi:hypothetical protein HJ01_03099 [Flavobacterium frigoris PS1]|uniref:Uncharacterized protein n=1 Tax=Flavobacterium frigoris (strain PS1) TaxID=1086011 RepID=H7FVA1_FLAFP|nr:hypothetical protein HJ01_03099 [Flavobacterium frigoris PS1]